MLLFQRNPQQKRAVAYYRHSAEDKQENSVPIQREHAQKFTKEHQIAIIHEEADEGKTGLLAERHGFTKLFQDWILNAKAPEFEIVLVYDVSRWGRFQDQDEAAYYEFLCKKKGKQVVYVARGFPREEHQLISHLQTSIERYMAAEYSRQLSEKVWHGCVKISQQGYSAGGPPCYGMARLLLDVNKNPIRILRSGEHKSIENERVSFIPARDQTTKTVERIFNLFVEEGKELKKIVRLLNKENILAPQGALWNEEKILRILQNEIYIGTRLYNKSQNRLKKGRKRNPRSEWVVRENAFKGIVGRELFLRAQEKIRKLKVVQKRGSEYTDEKARNAPDSTCVYYGSHRFPCGSVSFFKRRAKRAKRKSCAGGRSARLSRYKPFNAQCYNIFGRGAAKPIWAGAPLQGLLPRGGRGVGAVVIRTHALYFCGAVARGLICYT